jgi:hypothetical protein
MNTLLRVATLGDEVYHEFDLEAKIQLSFLASIITATQKGK